MIILQGTLRQFDQVDFSKPPEKPNPLLKLWIEHETIRTKGAPDLKIEELMLDLDEVTKSQLPHLKKGNPVAVEVQQWADGRRIAFKAIRLLSAVVGQNHTPSASAVK